MLGLLVKNFGLTTFKNWQLEAIKTVIKGKNALIIKPTGSRKTLCFFFFFPPFATEKLSIVITPTISLMAHQVKSLMEHGISAAHLGGKMILKCSLAFSLGSTGSFLLHQRTFYAEWPTISAFYYYGIYGRDWPARN